VQGCRGEITSTPLLLSTLSPPLLVTPSPCPLVSRAPLRLSTLSPCLPLFLGIATDRSQVYFSSTSRLTLQAKRRQSSPLRGLKCLHQRGQCEPRDAPLKESGEKSYPPT